MMFPYARRILLLSCSIVSLLSQPSNAWSIRNNSQGQPRLCSVVAASLNGITRIGLGNANSANNGKKQVMVTAKSNRDVLQGRFQKISISLKNNQSPWLSIDQLDIKGENLQFGYTPILIPLLCGEPCQFNYEFTLNNDNIAQSSLIRLFTKSILQSFMANSALPLAAAATDATNQLLKEVEDQQQQATTGDPTFGKGEYLYLPCVALLPNDQGNLSFTLRTKVRALGRSIWGNTSNNGLEFEAPASRVDVDAALPSNTNDWTRKFLPKVIWLPIGSPGMVLPLGRDTTIERINMNDERCQVQGKVQFFQEIDKTTSSLTSI
ncbi:hypothetical protein FRACYDRAFT_241201 [Fragilariopsis cylindrus CCMP1102]|uniref:Uncharacterized protein n=1 Tax=Fragilariopsis cylindrus CCMP1102 TaxID=635003 RepID=A0A1E7F937_9STRA|nr:hypothetical protein FRACYDRAFT_241201 [Fragilariopsis cylindrus CCMP1102]|eukprot:OEU14649.1 hypothetical protein FRACYDRAFT_241201 [Fragilariopsis cylindrus CCMP1102]